ncbi:type VI secretion system lipoprotein TssJ [Kistimonas scapharcae]
MHRHPVAVRMVLGLLLLLDGCSFFSGWFGQHQPTVTIDVYVSPQINPNAQEQATPVEWRIYQLSRRDFFDQADFLLLFDDDLSVLKGSLLNRRLPGSVLPGSQETVTLPLAQGAQYLAVMVAFANYPDATNKGVVVLRPDHDNRVRLDIENISARLTTVK